MSQFRVHEDTVSGLLLIEFNGIVSPWAQEWHQGTKDLDLCPPD